MARPHSEYYGARVMKRSDFALLLTLAALWGSSYLFLRLGAGEFGAVPLAGLRAGLAALVLLPLLAWRGHLGGLRTHGGPILVVALTQSALPFVLFGLAAPILPAGLSAILSATTPLFTAIIGWQWLGLRLDASRTAGLLVGFSGVLGLAWDQAALRADARTAGGAILACLLAALLYGFSAHYTKQRLAGVSPLVVAAGSQLASALMLALPAACFWPSAMPGGRAWGALGALAVACTSLAYVLFYGLLARVGAARTVTVTFLIPVFGVLWGALFLDETPTPHLALGCAVILAGTGLTTGLLRLPRALRFNATTRSSAP